MKIAVIQLGANENKEKNIEKALKFVFRAIDNRAQFILLPEAFNYRGKTDSKKGFKGVAEYFPGPSTKPLMEVARKHKVHILAGSICEASGRGQKAFNTSVLINARGEITAKYRKIHLFDALIGKKKLKESQRLFKGRKRVVSKINLWTAGLSICYDLRFPELYQWYGKSKVDMVCVPSAFTKMTGEAHWEVLLRARAIENLCYVLAPNQIGQDGYGVTSYGNSMIIDPWGKVLARASEAREEIIYARLEKNILRKRRTTLPGQVGC